MLSLSATPSWLCLVATVCMCALLDFRVFVRVSLPCGLLGGVHCPLGLFIMTVAVLLCLQKTRAHWPVLPLTPQPVCVWVCWAGNMLASPIPSGLMMLGGSMGHHHRGPTGHMSPFVQSPFPNLLLSPPFRYNHSISVDPAFLSPASLNDGGELTIDALSSATPGPSVGGSVFLGRMSVPLCLWVRSS